MSYRPRKQLYGYKRSYAQPIIRRASTGKPWTSGTTATTSFKRGTTYRKNHYNKHHGHKRRYYSRRTYKKKYHPRTGIGAEKIVKLTYVDTTNKYIAVASGAVGYFEYNLNSAYDVASSVGSTAMPGFTEWSDFYANYRVLRTKITTKFVNNDTINQIVGIAFRPIYNETGWGTSWDNWRKLEGNAFNRSTALGDEDGGNNVKTVSVSMNLDKLWGDKLEYLADGGFSAAISANPTVILQGYVYTLEGAGVSSSFSCNTETKVDMWIRFYGKRKLNQ